ncbi:MAG: exodeoxyribonuclease VII large subunit [Clostridium perfringens]|nr:exodeoxyribonuclease VII large subunit [Clostridium perfringens]
MKLKTLTVTEVNEYLKKTIDNNFILNNILLKGEISNFKLHSKGHMYFSLKDKESKINCIIFKSDAVNLDFIPEDGINVEVRGRISLYLKDGSLRLYCNAMKKAGVGELFEEFNKLKKELDKEGLFDSFFKRKIPMYPKRVGVVTSPTGAAIKDIITVIKRRNKGIDIILYPALVQGVDAPRTIIDGINYFNKKASVDVIIIGRGGGSIEELWAFNDRDLAYEIFNSTIPVISAVGHEVDFSISDYVSDLRAATPSAAGEIVSPSISEIINKLNNYKETLDKEIINTINYKKESLSSLSKVLKSNSPLKLLNDNKNNLDHLNYKMNTRIKDLIESNKGQINRLNHVLMTLNPLNTLSRGYSIVLDEDNNILSSVNELRKKDNITIFMKDGNITMDIKVREEENNNG